MRDYSVHTGDRRSVRDVLFLLGIAITLGLGLALASPALGSGLTQTNGGDISGTITVQGGNAAGITVELRQRANNGADNLLATTTTDESGTYHFSSQSSAPNDAYYQIKVTGGKGTLAVWYSFPIIYLSGQNFSVPSIEMSDVALLSPKDGAQITLPSKLIWQARRSGETFRVYVYSAADMSKAILDSGSLGMNTEYALPDGSLAAGSYEAVIQVRDSVVGTGVTQSHFRFTVGTAATGASVEATPEITTSNPTAESPEAAAPTAALITPTSQPSGQPELELHLTADKREIQQGDTIIFRIEVSNKGSVIAPDVVVTDQLPGYVNVDTTLTKTSVGLVSVDGSSVTAQIGDLSPNTTVAVEIPVSVGALTVNNVSNQASALYRGAANPALSNAYIVQVTQLAQPIPTETAAAAPTEPSVPTTEPAATAAATAEAPVAPEATAPAAPEATAVVEAPAAPTQAVVAAPPAEPAPTRSTGAAGTGGGSSTTPKAPIPQTGGSFPLALALLLLLATLVARYLRGHVRSRNGRRA